MKFTASILGIIFLFFAQSCVITVNENDDSKETEETNFNEEVTPSVEENKDSEIEAIVEGEFERARIRKLPPFTSLLHNISGNVVWKQGETQKVEIQAVPEVVEEVVTEVKGGGALYIGFRTPNFQLNDNKLYIFITTPNIKAIRLSGSGNLESKNRWNVENISLAISGSGNMYLNLKADQITTELSGSGNFRLKGKADRHTVDISGSGRIRGYDLKVEDCRVSISGSGSCQLYAKDNLDASINGSGSISYKGEPTVNKSINGSGSVSRR